MVQTIIRSRNAQRLTHINFTLNEYYYMFKLELFETARKLTQLGASCLFLVDLRNREAEKQFYNLLEYRNGL
jgi:hypothetical protein